MCVAGCCCGCVGRRKCNISILVLVHSVLLTNVCMVSAQEMTRHDKFVELLRQRQEKDIVRLNKVHKLAVTELYTYTVPD